MTTRNLKSLCLGGLALAGLTGLSACGLQGDLTRPDPLWGSPDDVPAAERPDRTVTDGLTDLREGDRAEDEEDAPNPDDELLGGPSL